MKKRGRRKALERLVELIEEAQMLGYTSAEDLAEYLLDNGVCDNAEVIRQIRIWVTESSNILTQFLTSPPRTPTHTQSF